jgi:hypothetical protein
VRLIAVLLTAAACTMILEVLGAVRAFLVGWERSIHLLAAALSLFTIPLTFRFFSRFPEWQRPGLPIRAIETTLWALMTFVFLPAWVVYFVSLE